ncbi:hypothetical protein QWJ20_21795 [Pectobacterium sp. S5]|uniref:hypothetical protein n=1 Tax=Pectobacterium TaxID=122277 RepID=UPI003D9B5834
MDFFEKDGSLSDDSLHPKFKVLRDEIGYYGARMTLSDWAIGFYDRDNKARGEFQKTFHSTFWEIYLHAVFKAMNFEFSDKQNRPDFILKKTKNSMLKLLYLRLKRMVYLNH